MKEISWKSKKFPLSISFKAFDDSNIIDQLPFTIWHQAPAIPKRKIRAGMLQFLSQRPQPEELLFLPAFLRNYKELIHQYTGYLCPPPLDIKVILGQAYRFGFYSQDPLGFEKDEIAIILEKIRQSPDKKPNLEQLGLTGTAVDVSSLKSVPPVFERISWKKSRQKQMIILGIHDHPVDQRLSALLGRFFHGLGHMLVAERVIEKENEQIAQSWATALLKAVRNHAHEHPCTVGQLIPQNSKFPSEVENLKIEQLCQVAIPATFTGELFEQKDLFRLLKDTKEKLCEEEQE
ncbi:MAG: hypothetical protein ACFFB3_24280 [Candidatus Hodarchaeota archaeon]